MHKAESRESILIVDDDVEFSRSLQRTLCKAGFVSTLAHDAGEALHLLGTESFDLVITDYQMGRSSGLDVISALRARLNRAKILLLSAFGDEEWTANPARLGADACLSKPVKRKAILDCISRLLSNETTEVLNTQLKGGN